MKEYKFLTLKEVMDLTRLPRSTLYYSMQESDFPRPIKMGIRRALWLQDDIEKYIERKISESRALKIDSDEILQELLEK